MDLVLLFLMQIFAVFAKHNEWYCQEADQKYQICRKCKTLAEDCDNVATKDCKCENLKFAKNDGSCKLEFIPKYLPPSIYLHLIFDILLFDILSLLNCIFFLV